MPTRALPGNVLAITRAAWSSFVDGPDDGSSLVEEGSGPGHDVERYTACVQVSGGWNGAVILECSAAAARSVAGALLMVGPDEVSAEDVSDTVGELANVIGGNLKALLPGPSRLSVPSVTSGDHYAVRVHGAEPVHQVNLTWHAEPLRVSVWEL